jgi:pSer/pThr/pTyr-binding forkhead associated (FHA) protein
MTSHRIKDKQIHNLPSQLNSLSPKPVAGLRWFDHYGRVKQIFLREGDTCLIGRDRINDIILKNRFISRRHAIIAWHSDSFEIADLGSRNGTFVNESNAYRPITLEDGDVIRLFKVKLVFEVLY